MPSFALSTGFVMDGRQQRITQVHASSYAHASFYAHALSARADLSASRIVCTSHRSPNRSPWHLASGPQREMAAWVLAVASLQSQRARGFRLPIYLKVCMPGIFTYADFDCQSISRYACLARRALQHCVRAGSYVAWRIHIHGIHMHMHMCMSCTTCAPLPCPL